MLDNRDPITALEARLQTSISYWCERVDLRITWIVESDAFSCIGIADTLAGAAQSFLLNNGLDIE